jgi:hypothetical protein
MSFITIDFETYYDKEFSLSKLTTEEYIRSPQFEVIGVGVKVLDGETEWASGTHDEIAQFLSEFDWANSLVLAHNTMFDGAILSWRFGIVPKAYADTLSMARALHGLNVGGSLKKLVEMYQLGEKGTEVVNALGKHREDFSPEELSKYGDYCINDVELTYQLFKELMGQGFPKQELKLIDCTLRMFTDPVLELDLPALQAHLQDCVEAREKLLNEGNITREEIMSNKKFAERLKSLGVEPPMKLSPRTEKPTLAFAKTDEAFLALQDHENPDVQALVAARLGTKGTQEETRTQRFIDIAKRGTLPVPIKYYAAHTGRWGGCLVADTKVMVYNEETGIVEKNITDVLLDDLVWDGEEFVSHDGVQFSGYQEVIEWDGVVGTPEHKVFTAHGTISLSEAMQRGVSIETPRSPTKDDVGTIGRYVCDDESQDSDEMPMR